MVSIFYCRSFSNVCSHSGVSMGNPDSDEYARKETCATEVERIVKSIG
ncbi:MAG: hypothetical protein Q4F44_06100 [Bacteroidales bacterium]|nr:hypothetical protein [Bacteroidales bacterium]